MIDSSMTHHTYLEEAILEPDDGDDPNVFCPSQARIRRLCSEFQKTWSRQEFYKRSQHREIRRWSIAEVKYPSEIHKKSLE